MALPDTFARRKRAANPSTTDVYSYGNFSPKLRKQISQILIAAIGAYEDDTYGRRPQNEIWLFVRNTMRRELGVDCLVATYDRGLYPDREVIGWMEQHEDVDDYLSALELLIRGVDKIVREDSYDFQRYVSESPDDAMAEINARILEAGFGYQYENGEIIQIDSLLLHKEAVLPAIRLTNDPKFSTANSEYMKAHEAFRHADYETCLTECAKSFESVLKIIAAERGWQINANDPASKLIEAAVRANFLQSYVAAGFTSLRSMLESGVAPVRNKTAAHGAGTTPRSVPRELAAFQLHQTASVIVFLIESHKAQG